MDKGIFKNVLNDLYRLANEKSKKLFDISDSYKLDIKVDLNKNIEKYNDLVDENNKSNLSKLKKEAKDALKYNLIHTGLGNMNYYVEQNNLKTLTENAEKLDQEIQLEKESERILLEKINKKNNEINDLYIQTQSETILERKINDVLKNYVFFEIKLKDEGRAYYHIRCTKTGEFRKVTELSTGEKNIVAFLYFLETLNEIKKISSSKPKLIVLDDPVSSNDDTMQYIILEKILVLIDKIKSTKNMNQDKLILLTHNANFYLNIKYNIIEKDPGIFRLNRSADNIEVVKIDDPKKDFKTSYEALWIDLGILYNSDNVQNNVLLNLIRRIIGTYTIFNKINRNDFLFKVPGAKKLFDIYSHESYDVEIDHNDHTKLEIIRIMQDCFCRNDSKDHFDKFIDIAKIEIK